MTFLTIIIFTINLYASNKKENSKDNEINDNKIYSIVVLGLIAASILFDLIVKSASPIIYGVVAVAETVYFIIQNAKREETIKKRHEEMKQLLQCLSPVINIPKDQELDLEGDYGFEFSRDKNGNINEIKCQMTDPDKWNDAILTKIVLNMNKYLPSKRWTSSVDYPNLETTFEGNDLPPSMAKYPGSWLRPWNYVPVGVNGENELGISYGAKEKNIGDSLFAFSEDNSKGGSILDHKADNSSWDSLEKGWRQANAVVSPKTPQVMICGSTGGGKAIILNQLVSIKI